jgi:rare lipoprotein A
MTDMPFPQNNRGRGILRLGITLLSLGAALVSRAQMVNPTKPEAAKPIEGLAMWYPVPPNSLAKRRAGKDELTAAHNRLPLGTNVRVTHLGNRKNVVVRITDRGIYKRGSVIDLCREAAEKLDMVREGSARVRLEILPDDKSTSKAKSPSW